MQIPLSLLSKEKKYNSSNYLHLLMMNEQLLCIYVRIKTQIKLHSL